MTTKLACVVMVGMGLAGASALAQANDTGGQDNRSTNLPVHKAAAPPADFVTQQAMTEWRAPKLVGVSVYGPDNKKMGSIKDILTQ